MVVLNHINYYILCYILKKIEIDSPTYFYFNILTIIPQNHINKNHMCIYIIILYHKKF